MTRAAATVHTEIVGREAARQRIRLLVGLATVLKNRIGAVAQDAPSGRLLPRLDRKLDAIDPRRTKVFLIESGRLQRKRLICISDIGNVLTK